MHPDWRVGPIGFPIEPDGPRGYEETWQTVGQRMSAPQLWPTDTLIAKSFASEAGRLARDRQRTWRPSVATSMIIFGLVITLRSPWSTVSVILCVSPIGGLAGLVLGVVASPLSSLHFR